jgi:hypothetical protein
MKAKRRNTESLVKIETNNRGMIQNKVTIIIHTLSYIKLYVSKLPSSTSPLPSPLLLTGRCYPLPSPLPRPQAVSS